MAYIMNFIKKLLFILLLMAVQLSVKTGAQTGGCGGTYSNQSGTISSPNYPSNYDNNLHCSYYIILPSNQTSVNITFISFDLGNGNDWLLIKCYRYDHKYIPDQVFGPSTLPPPLLSISSCPTVELLFETRASSTHQGFSLEYDIGNGLQGGLTMKPMNLYVRHDSTEPIVLSCSSRANQPGVYPWWSFSPDGCLFFYVTSPNCSVLPSIYDSDPTYFTTSTQYSTRTCNLAISAQYINNAVGFYTCTDATLDFAFALVDTIDFDFTVVDFSSSENEVVQGDQISLTCSVRLLHDNTSTCFQLTPSVYIYSGDNQRPISVSNTTASINVTASANVLPSYVCLVNFTFKLTNSYPPSNYATNLPENISSTKSFPPVLYWPENTSMVINGDDNGKVVANGILTCFVPANPPVTYQWTTQEYGLPAGPSVTVSRNGTYTCTATNAIRGKTHVASKSISVTITIIDSQKNEPEDKFNTVALAVGVVLGIVVLLLLVVAIVQCVLLRKKKNSATTDANYDYIDAAISTDADPAKDQRYELTQRERSPTVDHAGAVATSGQKDVPAMYDRFRRQTYDYEIPTGDKSQPYLQTRDIEIPVHTEDKSLPYVSLYE